jgi:hypothetical protein
VVSGEAMTASLTVTWTAINTRKPSKTHQSLSDCSTLGSAE